MISKIYEFFLACNGITTDSRNVNPGALFLALCGPTFNGNKFAKSALDQGAKYAIVDEEEYALDDRFILVDNGLDTLQELATYHRDQLNIPVLAITGSNGKTTTKELIAVVLETQFRIHFTQGNLNNHIGLPLTILAAQQDIDMLVLEMGANHIGEIADLCEIGKPTLGLITNIGKAHLEGFGSVEGIIQAKTELYEYLKERDGVVIINDTDEILIQKSHQIANRVFFGTKTTSIVYGDLVNSQAQLKIKATTGDDSVVITSKLTGKYNFTNIMAALAIGQYFKIDLNQCGEAIENYSPENNRSQIVEKFGAQIILDAYNANPSSMEEAIINIAELSGNRVLVLGDMMELGEFRETEHRKIIDLALSNSFDEIILVGNYFKDASKGEDSVTLLDNAEEVRLHLNSKPKNIDWILIKGSRKMKLEEILND